MSRESLPNLSEKAASIKVGSQYVHYKEFPYIVLGIARHSETLEELVVYQAQYGENNLWVRPVSMFLESVEVNGCTVPRFRLVKETQPECRL